MNRIEKLIEELCPEGVEYKELGEVCEFQRGRTITKKSAIDGDVPVIAGGQEPSYYHNEPNRKGETIAVSGSGAYAGFVTYWTIPVYLSDSFSVNPNLTILKPKYVYHFLKNIQEQIHDTKSGGGIPHVYGRSISKFSIPVPPLPIQEEIVNILDKFTTLEAELEAELEARKSQYEYYRNELLTPIEKDGKWWLNGVEVEWKTLGEIGRASMCKRIMKNQTSSSGEVPFYKIGTFGKQADAYIPKSLYNDYREKFSFPKKGTILLSASGTIGRTVIYDGEPAYFQDSNIVWIENSEEIVINKYLYYCYQIINWRVDNGIISRLYNNILESTKVPIPPLSEQERIVSILDKFDALVNDITVGLPAEIEARRKQYEYYRNKLLTFE